MYSTTKISVILATVRFCGPLRVLDRLCLNFNFCLISRYFITQGIIISIAICQTLKLTDPNTRGWEFYSSGLSLYNKIKESVFCLVARSRTSSKTLASGWKRHLLPRRSANLGTGPTGPPIQQAAYRHTATRGGGRVSDTGFDPVQNLYRTCNGI